MYFQLPLNEGVHPQNMVILPLELQLIADEKAEFFLGLGLQLVQSLPEHGVELFFNMCGLGVDFFDLEIYFAEIVGQLVLPPLDIGVDILDLGRNLGVGIFELDQVVLGHLPQSVAAADLAGDAQGLTAHITVQFQFGPFVLLTSSEILRFI